MNRILLLSALLLAACSTTPVLVFKPTDKHYILIQVRKIDHQRFDYVIDPSYEVRVVADIAEIWNGNDKIDTIHHVTNITWGPRPQ